MKYFILALSLTLLACQNRIAEFTKNRVIAIPTISNDSHKKIDGDLNALTEDLISAFVPQTSFAVVERSHADQLLQEIQLAQIGLLQQNKKAGRLLGADYILISNITHYSFNHKKEVDNPVFYHTELEMNLRLSARLVDIERGVITASSNSDVSKSVILDEVRVFNPFTINTGRERNKIKGELYRKVTRRAIREVTRKLVENQNNYYARIYGGR